MLKWDCKDRPDWLDLEHYARKMNTTEQSSNKTSSQNQYPSEQKSNFSPDTRKDQSLFLARPESASKSKYDSAKPDVLRPSIDQFDIQHKQFTGNPSYFNGVVPSQPNSFVQTASVQHHGNYLFAPPPVVNAGNTTTLVNPYTTFALPTATIRPTQSPPYLPPSYPNSSFGSAVGSASFNYQQPLFRPT